MLSSQVYRALERVPNRYTLCQTISQCARRLHVNGQPFGKTLAIIIDGVESGKFRAQSAVQPATER